MIDFHAWFSALADMPAGPHDWQRSLAAEQTPTSRLIRIPTGLGKTLGVLAAWLYHRVERGDDSWPRRLVWCLPMRVLVEQTAAVVREALQRQGILWDGSSDHHDKVGVHLLMGGTDPGGDWSLFPESCAVLIGTQDMLLSRALNRGYAAGRARWPLDFGLLSHDALWVIDEAQLMDVGLATTAQLQAFHDDDAEKGIRPRHTWWMSATLQPEWLESVDTAARQVEWTRDPTLLAPEQRHLGLGTIPKQLEVSSIPAKEHIAFARTVLDEHSALADGNHGRITLVVCNTVDRACQTFDALRDLAPEQQIELVHSRFRAAERARWRERFLSRAACTSGVDRIIVATQVVEAGVDISAGCLVSELAPWPSLVQRFGRCARYGGRGTALVVDRGRDDKTAPPYSVEQLDAAWAALETVAEDGGDVGIASLEAFEESLEPAARRDLYPYQPRHLLLRRELDELFDTTPDLTGADLDISRFIRSGSERDLLVFWLDLPEAKKGEPPSTPPRRHRPSRDELCAVPFLSARDWLCGSETKTNRKPWLRGSLRAWVWDWLDGKWVIAKRSVLTPGRLVCVAAECGGYRPNRGFDPSSGAAVLPVPPPSRTPDAEARDGADENEDPDGLSAALRWKTIGCHAAEVATVADGIAVATGLRPELRKVLALAARWHDLGKAHPAFQGAMRLDDRPEREDLAKAPGNAWLRPPGTYRTRDDRDVRPGLRHELASALALFAVVHRHDPMHPALLGPWREALELTGQALPDPTSAVPPTPCEQAVLDCSAEQLDLLAYLVACHHGKVRVALHAGPKDQDYRRIDDGRGMPIRGVREGDVLPPVVLESGWDPLPELRLSLEPAALGLSPRTGRSWRERTIDLQARFGPGALAWLEALLMAADRRASRLPTADPALGSDEGDLR